MTPIQEERGAVSALVAILMVTVLLALAALAVDLGFGYANKARATKAADAGALAGAADLPATAAVSGVTYACGGGPPTESAAIDAVTYACNNAASSDVTVTTPYNSNPEQILVRVCKTQGTFFARAIGVSTLTSCSEAVGARSPGFPCVICVLGSSGQGSLTVTSGTVSAPNGTIAVNSTDPKAINESNGAVTALPTPPGVICVVGGYNVSNGTVDPTPVHTGCPVPDPLSSLSAPSLTVPSPCPTVSAGNSDMTISPGVYCSISSSGTGQITMNPGTYVIKSNHANAITLNHSAAAGKSSLFGSGVMIYFACTNYPTPCGSGGEQGAGLSMSSGSLSLTASGSGTYRGISMFFDRNNTTTFTLPGGQLNTFSGVVYGPSAALVINAGNGATLTFDTAVLTKKITINGGNLIFDNHLGNVGGLGGGSVSLIR